jgi:hypothetical protein
MEKRVDKLINNHDKVPSYFSECFALISIQYSKNLKHFGMNILCKLYINYIDFIV